MFSVCEDNTYLQLHWELVQYKGVVNGTGNLFNQQTIFSSGHF